MDTEQVPAAAQDATATPSPAATSISAADAAVKAGNVAAFREARQAERDGKPLPAVDVKPAAAVPAAEATPARARTEPQLSKRQLEINDRAQRAVDAATAQLREEIAGLRAQLAAPRRDNTPAAPAQPTPKEYERYLAMPDAPNLEEFDSIAAHTAAMAIFIGDKRHEERETARQTADHQREAMTAHDARLQQFDARVAEAKAKDPAFLDRVQPITSQLVSTSDALAFNAALARGQVQGAPIVIGPLHSLTDELLDSPQSTALLDHFQAHPEAFETFKTLRSPREVTRELAKIEATLTPSTVPPIKTETSAPSPPTTLGTKAADPADPLENAVASRDFSGFRQARLAQRSAR